MQLFQHHAGSGLPADTRGNEVIASACCPRASSSPTLSVHDTLSLALHLGALFVILTILDLTIKCFSRRDWHRALDRTLFQGGALLLSWLILTRF